MQDRSRYRLMKQLVAAGFGLAIVAFSGLPLVPGQNQQENKPVAEKIPIWFFGHVELTLDTDKQNQRRKYPVLLYVRGTQPHWIKDDWFFWGYLWYQEADVIMEVDGWLACSWRPGREPSVGGQFVEELVFARYDPREPTKIPASLIPYPAHSVMVYDGDFSYAFGWNFGPRSLRHKEERWAYLKMKAIVYDEE